MTQTFHHGNQRAKIFFSQLLNLFDFFNPFSAEVTYGEYVLFIGMKGIGTLQGVYIVEKAIPIDYDPDLFLLFFFFFFCFAFHFL